MEYFKNLDQNLLGLTPDPRTKDWFLIPSMTPNILLVAGYILFVKVIGPRWMKNRPAFKLNKIIIYYNFLQVCLSAYIFYLCCTFWIFGDFNWRCQTVDYSNDPRALKIATMGWIYLMSKYSEFLDTIFFVLRKKNSQISVLHVVHHSVMPLATFIGVRYVAGGHATFFGLLNTFVHIIMYTYYLLAALGPKYQKYLWWKKYITMLQLAQFVIVFIHSGQLLFIECNYPRALVLAEICFAILFIAMFSNFYVQAYKTDKKKSINSKHEKNPGFQKKLK